MSARAEDRAAAPPKLVGTPVVFLRRGPLAADLAEDELEDLQRRHLDHLAALAGAGELVVYGPCGDQDDDGLRGICLYRRGLELDRVRALAEADPSVRAGRLAVEVLTWWTLEGALELPVRS